MMIQTQMKGLVMMMMMVDSFIGDIIWDEGLCLLRWWSANGVMMVLGNQIR